MDGKTKIEKLVQELISTVREKEGIKSFIVSSALASAMFFGGCHSGTPDSRYTEAGRNERDAQVHQLHDGEENGKNPYLDGKCHDKKMPADGVPDSAPDAGSTFERNLSLLEEKLMSLRWVSYAPTSFDPTKSAYPSAASIEADLILLYESGFCGIITYGAENSLENIPRLARNVGFDGVIMGVWLPNALQMGNGISQSEYVDGYCLGNENLERSYSLEELASAMEELREETGKPVTTTEEWGDYLGPLAEGLIAQGDWVFPNAHPYWAGLTNPAEAALWTDNRYNEFREIIPSEKILAFKEVGLPSAGEPAVSEERQRDYYQLLGDSEILFSYFEAFDQPWKDWAPVEPHWGLFYADRSPKAVATELLDDAD